MDEGRVYFTSGFRVPNLEAPFVPDLRRLNTAPNCNPNLLTFISSHRVLDREIKREPTVHARSMSVRISRVENVLVKMGIEVASESVELRNVILYYERELFVDFEVDFRVLRSAFLSEMLISEARFRRATARVRCRVDFNDVRQLKSVKLLLEWNSCAGPL